IVARSFWNVGCGPITLSDVESEGTGPLQPSRYLYCAPMPFLDVHSLSKTYRNAEVPVPVLNDLELTVERGEMLAIVGPSGIGKSTLLHLLGGLDRPDAGFIRVGDYE